MATDEEEVHGRGWSQLPSDLLEDICSHLTEFPDRIRFSSVCVQWRSIQASKTFPQNFPWMLVCTNRSHPPNHNEDGRVRFLSLSENRIYSIPLLEFRNHRIYALSSSSSCGLLVALSHQLMGPDVAELSISLVNPIISFSISLPPLSLARGSFPYFQEECTNVEVFGSTSYPIIAAVQRYNAYVDILEVYVYILGETSWCKVDVRSGYACDVLTHNGSLLLLNRSTYSTQVYDMKSLELVLEIPQVDNDTMFEEHIHFGYFKKKHFHFGCLVRSPSGQLLLVLGVTDSEMDAYTDSFLLYQLVVDDGDEKLLKWEEVNTIGDCTLFLTKGHAMCFASSEFKGCRGNCIYFKGLGNCDPEVGMFDIREGRVERASSFLYPFWFHRISTFWFVPSLCSYS